jgi:hypothetical protein
MEVSEIWVSKIRAEGRWSRFARHNQLARLFYTRNGRDGNTSGHANSQEASSSQIETPGPICSSNTPRTVQWSSFRVPSCTATQNTVTSSNNDYELSLAYGTYPWRPNLRNCGLLQRPVKSSALVLIDHATGMAVDSVSDAMHGK